MFVVLNKIVITQVSTDKFPNRNKVFTMDFCSTFTARSAWANLTDTATITLPRAIYFLDGENKITWDNMQVYGNPKKEPIIMRGDKITMDFGYDYYKPVKGTETFTRERVQEVNRRFTGFITKISNKTPIQIECEDNMFLLKQVKAPNKEWLLDGNSYTLEKMLKEMLASSPLTKNFTINTDNYEHKFGKFISYNVTIAQVLDELRKHYYVEAFFRGDELRCGIIRYYPDDRKNHFFHFQKNIISDSLEYTRADDLRVGVIAKSINKIELVSVNSSGKKKTKHQQLVENVGDMDGEVRTLFFYNITNSAELKKQAEVMLPFLKYEGFRGSFKTFGLPYVKHGDSVTLINDKLPEQNGTYLVREVEVNNSKEGGLRQHIMLDIRIDGIEKLGTGNEDVSDILKRYQLSGL